MKLTKIVQILRMAFVLERRTCCFPKCGLAFWVLPESEQRSCSREHTPGAQGESAWQSQTGRALEKSKRKKQDRVRMVARVRELYAQHKTSAEIIEILNREGFRKPQRPDLIDQVFLDNFRSRHLIDIPAQARQRPGRRKKA